MLAISFTPKTTHAQRTFILEASHFHSPIQQRRCTENASISEIALNQHAPYSIDMVNIFQVHFCQWRKSIRKQQMLHNTIPATHRIIVYTSFSIRSQRRRCLCLYVLSLIKNLMRCLNFASIPYTIHLLECRLFLDLALNVTARPTYF